MFKAIYLNDPDGATTVGCFVLLILAFSKKKKRLIPPLCPHSLLPLHCCYQIKAKNTPKNTYKNCVSSS